MNEPPSMQEYYARRAAEYERIYARPERQADLAALCSAIEEACAGRRVLDIACGTGFFSQHAARRARSLLGIDANEETLALARTKVIPNAEFRVGDAYDIPAAREPFDAALTTFWWSHIPRQRIEAFLRALGERLATDAVVLIADNVYVEGNSTPISRTDESGNTYQARALENGERYEVMKNFPDRTQLQRWGSEFGTQVEIRFLTYFWMLRYRAR